MLPVLIESDLTPARYGHLVINMLSTWLSLHAVHRFCSRQTQNDLHESRSTNSRVTLIGFVRWVTVAHIWAVARLGTG